MCSEENLNQSKLYNQSDMTMTELQRKIPSLIKKKKFLLSCMIKYCDAKVVFMFFFEGK